MPRTVKNLLPGRVGLGDETALAERLLEVSGLHANIARGVHPENDLVLFVAVGVGRGRGDELDERVGIDRAVGERIALHHHRIAVRNERKNGAKHDFISGVDGEMDGVAAGEGVGAGERGKGVQLVGSVIRRRADANVFAAGGGPPGGAFGVDRAGDRLLVRRLETDGRSEFVRGERHRRTQRHDRQKTSCQAFHSRSR